MFFLRTVGFFAVVELEKEIAREMHYDRTWILEIHKRGVGAVAQIIDTSQHRDVI